MNNKPLVSIIIPAFNAQEFISYTLESVRAQTYKNIEIIVIDDGSTDQTRQIVQSYGHGIRYHYIENSGGAAVPRNVGIQQSSGDFLCFLDADDIMPSDRIATQLDCMMRHPEVALVFSDYHDFSNNGNSDLSHFATCPQIWSQLEGKNEIVLNRSHAILADENFGIAGSFMVRKSLLTSESGFEPSLKACEDFHMYYRLARRTPVCIINKIGLLRRLHDHNMSGNHLKMYCEGIRSRTMLLKDETDAEAKRLLKKYISSRQRAAARYFADNGCFFKSLGYDWQVLAGPLQVGEAILSCKNIARNVVLATGLYSKR